MTRKQEEIIKDICKLMAGLQVPVSLGMNLGAAHEPWVRLHRALGGIGWRQADSYEAEFRRIFGFDLVPEPPYDPDAPAPLADATESEIEGFLGAIGEGRTPG